MAFAIALDPPLNGTNFHPFFYPTQSKISLLSPLYHIIGSNIDILQLLRPLTANFMANDIINFHVFLDYFPNLNVGKISMYLLKYLSCNCARG